MRHSTTIPAVLLLAACAAAAACSRAPQSRVTSLEAKIDGLTCPTCVPPLQKSLQAQYSKSAIEVDDDKDSAKITFAGSEQFSPAAFAAAVERVRMQVVSLRLLACGTIETSDGRKWLTAGQNRFLLQSDRDVPANQAICADGTLDTRSDPATYHLSAFTLQNNSGS